MAAPQNFYHQIFNLHPLLPFSETSVLHRDGRWKPPADGRWKASPLALPPDLGAAEGRVCSLSDVSSPFPPPQEWGLGMGKLYLEGWESFPQWR